MSLEPLLGRAPPPAHTFGVRSDPDDMCLYWLIRVSFCFQYSIQRSAFDRCAHLSQSGGTSSIANAAHLTLLVRQLLFFYKQSEDSKRLVSVSGVSAYPCLHVHQLCKTWWPDPPVCPCFASAPSACRDRSSLQRCVCPLKK